MKNMQNKQVVFCLTPTKNEEWIIESFLKAASLWADVIIVADQGSTDATLKICKKYKKVKVIHNNSLIFNEPERQKMLIDESRKIQPKLKHLLFALDADEFLSMSNDFKSELHKIGKLPKGTVVKFKWANIKLNGQRFWYSSDNMPFGYVDDGGIHIGRIIHSVRVPMTDKSGVYKSDLVVMHYQYADWNRMESKHRWYQSWEVINNPQKSMVDIYRQYHHMYGIKSNKLLDIPAVWYSGYQKNGVDINQMKQNQLYWWDKDVVKMINQYGINKFAKIDIWDNMFMTTNHLIDPRNKWLKVIHWYLRKTQKINDWLPVIVFDRLLKFTETNV